MAKNWKTYNLSEVIELIGGGTPKTTNPEYWNGNIPWLSVVDFGNNEKYVYETEKTITKKGLEESSTKILRKGQIIISARGTVGELAVLGKDMAFNQSCYGINANQKTENDFLYYLLKHSIARIKKKTHGAVFDKITKQTFENIEVDIPESKTVQSQIANILSSLDNKIELNLQMNQTLEAMAQAIFKEWFVDFKFPGSTGKLVDGLPKGWRMGTVSDMCEVNKNTLSIKDKISVINYIEISEVNQGIINNITTFSRGTEPSRAKRKLKHGDIAISTVRPDRGSYFLAIEPPESLIASTGFAVFTPLSVPFSFLYCFLTDVQQIEFYGKMADGAAYPAINPSVIMKMELPIPPKETLESFHSVTEKLLIKINENLIAVKTLTQIRDGLLSKLMTGKIELKA